MWFKTLGFFIHFNYRLVLKRNDCMVPLKEVDKMNEYFFYVLENTKF